MSDFNVWIGCLGCYNDGRLAGEWYEGREAGSVEIEHVCAHKDAAQAHFHEEMWVMDHEGSEGLLSGECDPMTAQSIADMIDAIKADGHPVEAVAAWRDMGNDLEEWDAPTRESFEDSYRGEWSSEEDYAQELYEDCGDLKDVPESLRYHIDWEGVAREMYLTSVRSDDGYYIFD